VTANISSRFFSQIEMRCRDGTDYPLLWADRLVELFSQLDVIREAWKGPLIIVSGYRTPTHNTIMAGASQSQHVEGRAVDLRPYKKDLTFSDISKLHRLINVLLLEGKLPLVGGVGVYPLHRRSPQEIVPGWVHCDTRPKPLSGRICRWEGERFGQEQAIG
jgi:uncharacterized protein YcbK (DUF882 family)